MALSESIRQWGNSTQEVKISKFKIFHMGWTPSLWTSFQTQKFWWELLRLKINEEKPDLVLQPCFKVPKNTFGHNSDNLGPFPIIFCHITQWIRRKFWPFMNFYSLLVKILKKLRKNVDFCSKFMIFKMHVPDTLWVPNLFGVKN